MWNEPTPEQLTRLPRLYDTEDIPFEEKIIYLHFFIGACDWYIAEYDGDDLFWGYVNLGDDQNAEWGYSSFQELKEITVRRVIEIDNDLYWKVKKFGEIQRLKSR